MKKCKAITTKGVRCKMNVGEGRDFCHFHRNKAHQEFVADNEESRKEIPYAEERRNNTNMPQTSFSHPQSSTKEIFVVNPPSQKEEIFKTASSIANTEKITEEDLLAPTVLVSLVLATLAIMGWFFL